MQKYISTQLNEFLDEAENLPPPKPQPKSVGEFVVANVDRLRMLADRGWRIEDLLQGLLDRCQDERKPTLRTLVMRYRRAASTASKPGRRRGARSVSPGGEE